MKKCNSELMKELKELQSLINFAQDREQRICTIAYSTREPNAMGNEYDYDFARKELADLQKVERRIKGLLAISNATTKIDGFDMTIAEGLVYLAQLSGNKAHLTKMASREKLERTLSNYSGVVEYISAQYDIKKAQQDLADVNREIAKLQMAIDRTNLTNMIEVS